MNNNSTNVKYNPETGTTYLPCNELQECVKAIQTITDLKTKLEYYNKHICGLTAYISTTDGLQCFGMAGNSGQGYGSPVFDFNPENKAIYLQAREKEIRRLQRLLNKGTDYKEKVQIFFEQKAGQKDFTALKFFSNNWLEFLLNGGGTIPDNIQRYAINLEPQDKEQIATLNQYQKAYYLESLSDPEKANRLFVDAYSGFKFQPEKDTFEKQLNRAFDRTATINDKIKEIENSGLINDLKNGIEPDLSQNVLSPDAVKFIIHKEQLYEFWKWLKTLLQQSSQTKSNHETDHKPTFESKLNDNQITELANLINLYNIFQKDTTLEELKTLFSLTLSTPIQVKNNIKLAWLFSCLRNAGFVTENWKKVINQAKCFIGAKGSYITNNSLAKSRNHANEKGGVENKISKAISAL